MEKLLEKFCATEIAKTNEFDDAIKKLLNLKIQSNNFVDLIKNQNILLDDNTVGPFYDFLYSYYKIYKNIDQENFIKEIEKEFSEKEVGFWKSIFEYLDFVNSVERETCFIKEMNIKEFKDLMLYTFNNNVLYNGLVKEYKQWSKENVRVAQKTINTFLSCMVVDFNQLENVKDELDMRFHFEYEKYEYIWDLCNQNKIYLMLKNLIERLESGYYINKFNKNS